MREQARPEAWLVMFLSFLSFRHILSNCRRGFALLRRFRHNQAKEEPNSLS